MRTEADIIAPYKEQIATLTADNAAKDRRIEELEKQAIIDREKCTQNARELDAEIERLTGECEAVHAAYRKMAMESAAELTTLREAAEAFLVRYENKIVNADIVFGDIAEKVRAALSPAADEGKGQ